MVAKRKNLFLQRGQDKGSYFPYLFFIATNKLSQIIEDSVNRQKCKLMIAGRHGLRIPHLLFVDNLIFFVEALSEQIKMVKDKLDNFCMVSGLKINVVKTSIVFS
ncbi:hypothetical protein S245_021042 [Arachis hypogaea]